MATVLMKKELSKLKIANVKPAYLVALIYLWNEMDREGAGLRLNELAKSTSLGSSTITSLIDRMERDDLVKRKNDPADRRALLVYLTAKGKKIKIPVLNIIDKTMSKVLNNIPNDEINKHKTFLIKVLSNIYQEME